MSKKQDISGVITSQGILPLYFHADPVVSELVLRALYAAGVRAVEYTNRGESALNNFQQLRKTADKELPGLQLGIGTIKNKKEAKSFLKAGADFIICPGMLEEVAEAVQKEDGYWIPGCMTVTEIVRAEAAGAELIKLFPGSLLGPGFVSAVKEIFPSLIFMPTGGVDVSRENLSAWFAAGVSAVGLGSKLITKDVMDNARYEDLTRQTAEAIALVKEIRG